VVLVQLDEDKVETDVEKIIKKSFLSAEFDAADNFSEGIKSKLKKSKDQLPLKRKALSVKFSFMQIKA
jgi:hypothetical protein